MVGPGTDVGDSQRRVRTAGTAVRVTTSVLAFCYTAAIIVGFHWRGIETVVTLLVTAGLCLPYIVTRHRPVGALTVMLVAAATQHAAHIPAVPGDLMILLGVYEVAYHRKRSVSSACALATGLLTMVTVTPHGLSWQELTPLMATWGAIFAAWLWGVNTRLRHRHEQAVMDHAEYVRREQDSLARLAAAEERARIARDMHDVISHSLAGVLSMSEAMRQRPDDFREQDRRALDLISMSCRRALTEFRTMLQVLHQESDVDERDRDLLTEIKHILDEVAMSGLSTRLETSGDRHELAPPVRDVLLRVAQEATTNVLKHARETATEVVVSLRFGRTTTLEVADDGASAEVPDDGSPGFGLRGMRERVDSVGGTLTVRRGPDGYTVRAEVPTPHQNGSPHDPHAHR